MAAITYTSKSRTLASKIWDGTTLADITTLAATAGTATIAVGALTITIAGETVIVPYGEHYCVDSDLAVSAQTPTEIAAEWTAD
jgi:hypothetical protein